MGILLYAFAKMLNMNNTDIKKLKFRHVFNKRKSREVRIQITSKDSITLHTHLNSGDLTHMWIWVWRKFHDIFWFSLLDLQHETWSAQWNYSFMLDRIPVGWQVIIEMMKMFWSNFTLLVVQYYEECCYNIIQESEFDAFTAVKIILWCYGLWHRAIL